MNITYHLVPQLYFDALDPGRDYTPRDFAREGFIHCTDGADEMARTANRYYRTAPEAFYYLTLDKDRLRAPWRYDDPVPHQHAAQETKDNQEPPRDAASKIYPHIYGALNRDAIIAIRPARRDANGNFLAPEPLA